MKKTIFLTSVFVIGTLSAFALAGKSKSPFSKLGYKKQVIYTSSKGEFDEFHSNADVVEIGSVYFNTKTNEVVGLVNQEKEKEEVASATSAMSVDPLCEKYYWISPYAYCMNNPVKFVDPDGKIPRVYVETKGVGHTFVTTGVGKDITVYTYGRYGSLDKDKSSGRNLSMSGEGVLVVMKGEEALKYIEHEINDKGAFVYDIKDGSDKKIDSFFSNIFESSDKKPTEGAYKDADNARVVDTYDLLGNNCTTKSVEAVKVGTDGKLDLKAKGPANADTKLYNESLKSDSKVRPTTLKQIKDEYEKDKR